MTLAAPDASARLTTPSGAETGAGGQTGAGAQPGAATAATATAAAAATATATAAAARRKRRLFKFVRHILVLRSCSRSSMGALGWRAALRRQRHAGRPWGAVRPG